MHRRKICHRRQGLSSSARALPGGPQGYTVSLVLRATRGGAGHEQSATASLRGVRFQLLSRQSFRRSLCVDVTLRPAGVIAADLLLADGCTADVGEETSIPLTWSPIVGRMITGGVGVNAGVDSSAGCQWSFGV